MLSFMSATYLVSALIVAHMTVIEIRQSGIVRFDNLAASAFLIFMPMVNTAVAGFAIGMWIERLIERIGWDRLLWRRG